MCKAEASSPPGWTAAVRRAALGLAAAATVALPSLVPVASAFEAQQVYGDMAKLTPGDPVKNPYALLRNALPISNKPIRQVQRALESISEDLRVPGVRFSGVSKSVNGSLKIVTKDGAAILKDVAPQNAAKARELLASLKAGLEEFKVVVDNKDKQQVSNLGKAKSSLGDAKSSLGDTKSSLGDMLRARWVTLIAG